MSEKKKYEIDVRFFFRSHKDFIKALLDFDRIVLGKIPEDIRSEILRDFRRF